MIMRLFAQNGFQEGKKIEQGIEQNVIDGIIYSPRDVTYPKLVDKLNTVRKQSSDIETFFICGRFHKQFCTSKMFFKFYAFVFKFDFNVLHPPQS